MITCPGTAIEQSLAFLRGAGQLRKECVVLWLGKRNGDQIVVQEAYRPLQLARADQFRIPPEGMTELQARLRANRLMVAAQIHSHPKEAFHSKADDEWAIVRHFGALSLVVPRFAADTDLLNFLDRSKVYRFSESATWDEVPSPQVSKTCLTIS